MRRPCLLLASAALLLADPDVYSQARGTSLLLERNAALQAKVDSLERLIALMEAESDPWAMLTGLDDTEDSPGVSSLDDAPETFAACVARASPSLGLRPVPAVAAHVGRCTGRNRAMTERALGRYARHYDHFRRVFMEYGVPEELTALCIVESAVTPSAVSPAGAVGMWQIMPSTARQYGLVVDGSVDERTDVEKSTRAAARFLRDLHVELRSWPLAVMAYNCGAEAVRRAQIRSGGSSDPWTVLRHLPSETQAYLPAFLAISYLTVYGESREGLEVR